VGRGEPKEFFGRGVDGLFASLRQLTKTYYTAQRSYRSLLPDPVLEKLREHARDLRFSGEAAYLGNPRPDPIKKGAFLQCAELAMKDTDELCQRLRHGLN
jgi:hypothetical protein